MNIKIFEFGQPDIWEHAATRVRHSVVIDTDKIAAFASNHPVTYSKVKPILDHITAGKSIDEVPFNHSFIANENTAELLADDQQSFAHETAYMLV